MSQKTRKRPGSTRIGQTRRLGQTRSWIAMGTLAAYAAMGGTRSALAAAAKANGDGAPAATLTAEAIRHPFRATGRGDCGV